MPKVCVCVFLGVASGPGSGALLLIGETHSVQHFSIVPQSQKCCAVPLSQRKPDQHALRRPAKVCGWGKGGVLYPTDRRPCSAQGGADWGQAAVRAQPKRPPPPPPHPAPSQSGALPAECPVLQAGPRRPQRSHDHREGMAQLFDARACLMPHEPHTGGNNGDDRRVGTPLGTELIGCTGHGIEREQRLCAAQTTPINGHRVYYAVPFCPAPRHLRPGAVSDRQQHAAHAPGLWSVVQWSGTRSDGAMST